MIGRKYEVYLTSAEIDLLLLALLEYRRSHKGVSEYLDVYITREIDSLRNKLLTIHGE
jgi:hypothetical protein